MIELLKNIYKKYTVEIIMNITSWIIVLIGLCVLYICKVTTPSSLYYIYCNIYNNFISFSTLFLFGVLVISFGFIIRKWIFFYD